jgi:hypothetical protein
MISVMFRPDRRIRRPEFSKSDAGLTSFFSAN